MSTIVITKDGIAHDSIIVWGSQKEKSVVPKVFFSPHEIFCITGEIGPARYLAEKYITGRHPHEIMKELQDDVELEMAVITPEDYAADRLISYSGQNHYGDYMPIPHFMGSGADFARGAFLGGCNAAQSASIAAQCDISTGGAIKFVHFANLLERMENIKDGYYLCDIDGNRVPRPR